jgi:hypothetical protein
MIGQCIEDRTPFGICLIRRGSEVGGPAEPFRVGTTAFIQHVQRLEEGRMNIVCLGGERFRIIETTQTAPFLLAEVEAVSAGDANDTEATGLIESASALFAQYVRLNLAISNQWARTIELPSEATALSDYIAGRLAIDTATRQKLLEEPSPAMRLAVEAAIMEDSLPRLARRVEVSRANRWHGFAFQN